METVVFLGFSCSFEDTILIIPEESVWKFGLQPDGYLHSIQNEESLKKELVV